MAPLVSILIPAFNAESTIADTIASAVAQSWPSKEVIVVDDGSADQTLRIAKSCASSAVSVIHQQNAGAASARNKALAASQGDYIQWLDADDLLSVDKVSRQMRALSATGSIRTLASSEWGYFRYRPWKAKFRRGPLWEDLDPAEWIMRKWETNSHMQTATWLVSRQLTQEAGAWDTRLLSDDDGEFFSRMIVLSDGVRFVPGARVYYRISPTTRLSYIGTSDVKTSAQFLGMTLQVGYLRSIRDDQRARAACASYFDTWLGLFYPNRLDIMEQARSIAREWGRELQGPRLPWKYRWIQRMFGWPAATAVQHRYNEAKLSALRTYDLAMLKAQGRRVDVTGL